MFTKISKIIACVFIFSAIATFCAYLTLTTIVKSEKEVTVPDLIGNDILFALETLTDLKLDIKLNNLEFHDTITKNHIIYQEPLPGTVVKRGRSVNLTLSKGNKYVSLPNLTWMPFHEANLILERHHLKQGNITKTYDPDVPADTIISHLPPEGTLVKQGDTINFLISAGSKPEYYIMPDLVGMSADQIFTEFDSIIKIREIKSIRDDSVAHNVVLNQDPLAGSYILKDTPVNFEISQNSDKKIAYNKGARIFKYRMKTGFLKRHTLIRMQVYGLVIHLLDDFMKPGDSFGIIVPLGQNALITVIQDDEIIRSEKFE